MWRTLLCLCLLETTAFLTAALASGIPPVSILHRKGKRWPEGSPISSTYHIKQPANHQRHINPGYQASHTDLFAITGINKKNRGPFGQVRRGNSFREETLTQRRSSRSHWFSENMLMRDQSHEASYLNPVTNDLEEQVYDKDFSPGEEDFVDKSQRPQFTRGCYDGVNNCSESYPFPSSAIMIEAHYNQTVRDFLQICTPIEKVEISGIGDVQDLLNTLYQQIRDQEQFNKQPFSIILIFNLENYASWTRERVVDVLQAAISTLQNDFDETTIYSKFHQDGSDVNDTNLLLAYDIKYWLSNVCYQRLVSSCADFASIILESVLQMNDLDNDKQAEDTSVRANARWCQKLGMGPGSRIIDIKASTVGKKFDNNREDSSLVLADILPRDSKTYDKNRAPKYFGQPTIVYFHVTVLSIDTINEESMTYVADIFLAQSWRDHRLRLPENMTEEYRILDVRWLNDIWRPDCFFKNAKKVTFHEMSVPNHYLWLYHDKTLIYMAKLTLVLSCAMKFESYPHDTQICSMQIESLSHTTHDLVFKWNITDPLVTNPDIELPQLDIAKNSTEDCTLEYSTGNFTCLAIVFNLRRRLGYHLFHTYIPSALIVVMSWISFWIKPEAIPARATLGVTSLLTLATQSTQSQRSLPPVSYVKAIDVWMSSCTVFVFMSLMEFAVVNSFMGPVATKPMKGYSDEDLSSCTRQPVFNGNSSLRARGKGSSPIWPGPPPPPPGPQYVTFCNGREVALFIDKWSRLFFPFSFIILNVVYWTTFLH